MLVPRLIQSLPLIHFQTAGKTYSKIALSRIAESSLRQRVFIGNDLFRPVMKCQKPVLIQLHTE